MHGFKRTKLDGLNGSVRIFADNDHVYGVVKHLNPAQLARIPTSGGAQETVHTLGEGQIYTHVVIDDSMLFVATSPAGEDSWRLLGLPKSGGDKSTLLAQSTGTIDGVAVDSNNVYYGVWVDGRRHEIFKVAKQGERRDAFIDTSVTKTYR